MFICDDCLKEKFENEPTIIVRSFGPCEICGMNENCNDIPSKYLIPKKINPDKDQKEENILTIWNEVPIRCHDYIIKSLGEVKNENLREIIGLIKTTIPDHNDVDSIKVFYILKHRGAYDNDRWGFQRKTQVDVFIQFQTNEHSHADDLFSIGTIMKVLDHWGSCNIAYWNGWSEDLVLEMIDVDDKILGESFLRGDVPDDWIPYHHLGYPRCPYTHKDNDTPTNGHVCPHQFDNICTVPSGACYRGAPVELKGRRIEE